MTRKPLIRVCVLFAVVSLGLLLGGLILGNKTVELTGGVLLGGTFIPLPLDNYVLYLSGYYEPISLGILAGTLNTLAVLFERLFFIWLLAGGRGRRIRETVNDSKLSAWFGRAPFATIFVAAFSFLPFEPFRFLAVSNGYSVYRYAAGTFLGRTIRYIGLLLIGDFLAGLGWLGPVMLVLLLLYFVSLLDSSQIRGLFARAVDDQETGDGSASERHH